MFYQVQLYPTTSANVARVTFGFTCQKDLLIQREEFSAEDTAKIKATVEKLEVHPELEVRDSPKWLDFKITTECDPEDDSFRRSVAQSLRGLIEVITPAIDDIVNERNEQ